MFARRLYKLVRRSARPPVQPGEPEQPDESEQPDEPEPFYEPLREEDEESLTQRLYGLDRSSAQFLERLDELLQDEGWMKDIERLSRHKLVKLIDYLDNILDGLDRTGSQFKEGLHALRKLCGSREIVPTTCLVSGKLSISTTIIVEPGAYGEIRKGSLDDADVCIKNRPNNLPDSIRKCLCREAVIWKYLDHPNIVSFKGVTLKPPQLVLEWTHCRELEEYIKENRRADLISLLLGIAEGLSYLHSCNVIHGNLRGAGILVDTSGIARIADFCRARIARNKNADGRWISASSWAAPEIWLGDYQVTRESDIFSFGMVIIEVFTEEFPFGRNQRETISKVKKGERPRRPNHSDFTESLWVLTQRCWSHQPQDRPNIKEVIEVLKELNANQVTKTSPTVPKDHPTIVAHESGTGDITSETGKDEAKILKDPSAGKPLPALPGEPVTLPKSPTATSDVASEASASETSSTPALPRVPTKHLPREEIVDEVLDLTDQVASTALFGPIGVGKSFVAHTLLHHERTQAKFGTNRHLMRCDGLTSSLDDFLEHLSDVINADRVASTTQLQSHLESSPPFILLLDGVDLILDPLAPEAEEISATIEELGSYPHVCLVTTSRMNPEIPGFHRLEVPIPSEDDARDTFYDLCNLGRTSVVDDLIARLDFHPLSIDLLARSVRENECDESTLLRALDDDQTSSLKKKYREGLKDAIEISFRCPTIQNLGTTAQSALEAIAAFPQGVEECRLRNVFPHITGIAVAVDVLCKFFLLYREDGFVKMHSPFRFYILESTLTLTQHVEVIHWDASCHPANAPFPVFTNGPILCPTVSHATSPRRGTSKREKWIRRFESVKKRLRALFGHPEVPPIIVIDIEEEPVTTPPIAPAPQTPSMPALAYEM